MINPMRKKIAVLLLLLAGVCFSLYSITIKIGTVAPAGSPWDQILHSLAGQWEKISDGKVHVQIYPGGVAGGESDMIRKMRIGQLQGAALTQLALGRIVPDILAIDVPFLIETDGEFNYVLRKTRPYFDKRFSDEGYRLLTWSSAGWVRFFSTKPIGGPEELKKFRLGVPAGDDELLNTWRNLGFNAISLPIPDIMAGLQSGMIDAFYSPPSAAVVYQWFRGALYMSGFRVVPVIVGLIIDDRVWQRIPKELRPQLLGTMGGIEDALNRVAVNMDQQAIDTMKQHGLIVDPTSAKIESEWRELGAAGETMVVGKLFSTESLALVKRYLKEYRDSHPQVPSRQQ